MGSAASVAVGGRDESDHPLVAQGVKDPALSLLWLWLLRWCRLDPWLGNFCVLQEQPPPQKNQTIPEGGQPEAVGYSSTKGAWHLIMTRSYLYHGLEDRCLIGMAEAWDWELSWHIPLKEAAQVARG